MKPDIQSTQDIDLLVDTFYSNLASLAPLQPYFAHVNWQKHLPIMKGFWYFTLLNLPGTYTGNVMQPHIHLHKHIPFTKESFQHWLDTFYHTVDALFSGPKAEEAKQIAYSIGLTMRYKLLGSDYSGHSFSVTPLE